MSQESAICEFVNFEVFQDFYQAEIRRKLDLNKVGSAHSWSDALAIGSAEFVEDFKQKSGIKAKFKTFEQRSERFYLKEPVFPYSGENHEEIAFLREKNVIFWITIEK